MQEMSPAPTPDCLSWSSLPPFLLALLSFQENKLQRDKKGVGGGAQPLGFPFSSRGAEQEF